MTQQIIYAGNTNVIEVQGLRDAVTNAYVNDATIALTLVDADGSEVIGVSWPVSGSYISASDGVYKAVISTSAAITAGLAYTAKVTATSGANVAHWEIPIIVRTRAE